MYFDSRRSTVLATNGMVATSQPLASVAGLQVLMEGGNAVDAAICTAATLNVVEPNSTGVGGDVFALMWNEQEKSVRALNGSGRASSQANLEELRAAGHHSMPNVGPYSVAVPGTVHGWETLRRECGSMPLDRLLAPAIRYAEEGFPVSEVIAFQWDANLRKISSYPSGQEFLVDGQAPVKGHLMRLPTLGRTMRAIAEGGTEAFYHGELARKMSSFVEEHGGWLTLEDLAGTLPTGTNPSPSTTGASPAGNVRPTAKASLPWRPSTSPRGLTYRAWAPSRPTPITTSSRRCAWDSPTRFATWPTPARWRSPRRS